MILRTQVGKILQTLIASFAFFLSTTYNTHAQVNICTTTSLIADLVSRIGGKNVHVHSLMGPGVDPHLYKATASDIIELNRCQIIFYNGLHLEGRMIDIFESLAKKGKTVIAVSEAIPKENLIKIPNTNNQFDPHIWFDPLLWQQCADVVRDQLSKIDPQHTSDYVFNAQQVQTELQDLFNWGKTFTETLPPSKRILVTSHDAYNYFGKAFDFTVIGVQGISTTSEAGLADIVSVIDFIKKHHIRAIFVESSVPHNTIDRIAQDSGAKVGGELFSDALGAPNDICKIGNQIFNVGTYSGMLKYNMTTIIEALK